MESFNGDTIKQILNRLLKPFQQNLKHFALFIPVFFSVSNENVFTWNFLVLNLRRFSAVFNCLHVRSDCNSGSYTLVR